MMEELKPCPFCGDTDVAEQNAPDTAQCFCSALEGRYIHASYWNTRPIEDALRADLARKDELIEALRGVNVAYEKLRLKFVGIVIGMTEALEAAELEAEGLEAALGRLSELTDALVAARTRLAEVEENRK